MSGDQPAKVPENPLTHDLLVRLQNGDDAAVEILYPRFAEKIYNFAKGPRLSRQDAEDLVEEVFDRILNGISTYDRERAGGERWIWRIAYRARADHYRKTPVVDSLEAKGVEIGELPALPDSDLDDVRQRCFSQVLKSFSEAEQAALWRRLERGRPSNEWHVIAERFATCYRACVESSAG